MKMSSGHAKPTHSQQGTYNAGTKQALNAYKGVKKSQSGSVGNSNKGMSGAYSR
jgi:hypothetical protein